jgi:uncharacterized membrane protein
MNTFISELSGKRFPTDEKIHGKLVRPAIIRLIQREYPEFDESKTLALTELNSFKKKYIDLYLDHERCKLSKKEMEMLAALKTRPDSLENPDDVLDLQGLGRLDRISDRVASFGGSWAFIVIFFCFFLCWIVLNTIWLIYRKEFDPYPFVLLNLILSYLSTLQAPIIMMSQNRHAARDRHRAKEDFTVNLKTELEIHALHDKLDHLIVARQQEQAGMLKIEVGILNDIRERLDKIQEQLSI